jgi:NitT/TauT family transport system permease protein
MISNNKSKAHNTKSGIMGFIKRHKKAFVSIGTLMLTLALWFIIWLIAAKSIGISFILPSPIEAFSSFFKLLPQKEFVSAVAGSIFRVISGFLLGIISGAAVAFLAHGFLPVKVFFAPLIRVIRATPVASFILICVLWMETNTVPVFIAFLMVFPIVYENVLTGLSQTDRSLLEVAKVYGFSHVQKILRVYVPSVLPYFGSASTTSLGLAWKSCVSAEVLAVCAKSVGYYIYVSKMYFETEQLFAWTIAIVILSIILEYAVKGISALVIRYTRNRFGGGLIGK